MRPNITITIPVPYLPLDAYCELTSTPVGTAREMIKDGRLTIKPKKDKARGLVEVNMAALTIQALSECNIALSVG